MRDVNIIDKLPEIKTTNQSLVDRAKTLAASVLDENSFKEAGEFLVDINRRLKWWTELVNPAIDHAYKAHKEICRIRSEISSPLEQAKITVGNAMGKWRHEENARAAEEARKEAEKLKKQQEDVALAAAEQLQDAGQPELADAIISQPITPVVFAKTVPKANGVSFTSRWKAEVVDLAALVAAVVAGKVPLAAIEANTMFLNRQAVALKNEMKYPGVQVREEQTVAVRT